MLYPLSRVGRCKLSVQSTPRNTAYIVCTFVMNPSDHNQDRLKSVVIIYYKTATYSHFLILVSSMLSLARFSLYLP